MIALMVFWLAFAAIVFGAYAWIERERRLALEAMLFNERVKLDDPLIPEDQKRRWREDP